MATFSDTFDVRPHTLQLIVTTESQSISGNYSDLSCVLKIVKNPSWDSYSLTSSANSYTATIDGATVSGNFTFDFRSTTSKTLRTWTKRVYHNGSGTKTATVSAAVFAAVIGDASVSGSYSPADIMQAPTAPTAVTATRPVGADTPIGIAWTRNATSAAPYTGQSVRVSIDGAASVLVANVSATATTYSYTAAANHKYVFYVAASNSAGSKTSAASNIILTTPAPLATLAAAVVVAGTMRLTLPKRPTPYTEANVVITETHNGGTTWNTKTTLAMSALSATATTTWDDTSAQTSGTVQYRAIVQTTGGTQGTLSSAYKTSNTMVLNTPPLAPTNLTPSGGVDASNVIRLAWTHKKSSDGAAQSSRKIEYSTNSGSSWTSIVAGNTAASYYDWTLTLGSFTAGATILFRVATAGSQPGTYGAWSASQSLTLYGSLAVTFVTDQPPTTHPGGPIPVGWTSSPTWGTATQAQYQVAMADDATGLTVYDTGMLTGATQYAEIPSSVQADGHNYTVTVTLIDNHQITSPTVSAAVETDYLAPGPVTMAWFYDDATGTLVLFPTFSAETSSSLDDTVMWTLERSLDGDTWELVSSSEDEAPIGDTLARLGAASWYRSVAYSDLGIAGEPTVVEIPAEDVQSRWGWLNFGAGFQAWVRFGWSQTVEISSGRASESYEIEGLDYPGAVFGQALADRRSVSGKLLSGTAMNGLLATSTGDEMVAMSKQASVCVFRDPRGNWFTARVSDMKVAPTRVQSGRADEAPVSFTIERISA